MEVNKQIIKEINVSNPWFRYICNNQKRIEGRLNKGKFNLLKKGDIVKVTNDDKHCFVKILKIVNYKSFEEYLVFEGLKRTLPGIKTIKEGIDVYRQFYSAEDENLYGILAVYLKKVKIIEN